MPTSITTQSLIVDSRQFGEATVSLEEILRSPKLKQLLRLGAEITTVVSLFIALVIVIVAINSF